MRRFPEDRGVHRGCFVLHSGILTSLPYRVCGVEGSAVTPTASCFDTPVGSLGTTTRLGH